ncbi:MAG: type II toxin-antitoxin system VapC family toxin [Candidatus Competibacter sp.]|nr:type II toxin-antitoxin system VapC family toxin [Candidatus Competibacter sp.]MDG4584930.1 type II toxin-antitoxin system VapC family toxin [Candidatus Competibacter sp.]
MKYLLDTNVCVRYLAGRSLALRARLEATPPEELAVCSVVKAELRYGAYKSQRTEATLLAQDILLGQLRSLPFDDVAAEVYGRIRAALERAGTPIGANDLLIAAIVLANRLILVTHNTAEFSRVPGLAVEDWETE